MCDLHLSLTRVISKTCKLHLPWRVSFIKPVSFIPFFRVLSAKPIDQVTPSPDETENDSTSDLLSHWMHRMVRPAAEKCIGVCVLHGQRNKNVTIVPWYPLPPSPRRSCCAAATRATAASAPRGGPPWRAGGPAPFLPRRVVGRWSPWLREAFL